MSTSMTRVWWLVAVFALAGCQAKDKDNVFSNDRPANDKVVAGNNNGSNKQPTIVDTDNVSKDNRGVDGVAGGSGAGDGSGGNGSGNNGSGNNGSGNNGSGNNGSGGNGSGGNGSGDNGSPKKYTAVITWDAPTARENGDALTVGEIKNYTLCYRLSNESECRYVSVNDPQAERLELANLTAGTYMFRMQTHTHDGLKSVWTEYVSATFEG